MRKLFFLIFMLLLSTNVFADITQDLNIEEEDGAPSTFPYKLKVANGTLTDNGDGTSSLSASTGAPSTADYLVGTTDAGLSAEIVVGTTPGGELGNTWASPTLDDSVAVTNWNLTTPTFTTQFTMTAQADPTTDADGEVALDTDGWGTNFDAYEVYNGTASAYLVATTASDTPSNGEVPKFNTGGSITWEADVGGTAQIDINFPIQSAKLSGDNSVRIDAGLNGGATPYIMWRVLYQDGTNDISKNIALWQGRMPDNYAGGALTANIDFAMLSTDTSDVTFGVSICAITSGDAVSVTTESFDAENTKTQGAPTTVSRDQTVSITLTNADGIAAGDWFMVKLRRDGSDAIAGDAGVIAFAISE